MARFKFQLQFLLLALLLVALFAAQSARMDVQAEVAITPTITPTPNSRNYLPVVRAMGQAPPPTATSTPTATATPEPTDTPVPGRLAAPTLFDIINNDADSTFTVGWSSVADAEFFRLEERRNSGSWRQVYEGPSLSLDLQGLSDGQYCYRVRAVNAITDSEWSGVKCTAVITPTSTPTPGRVPPPVIKDIENADGDGYFAVEWTEVAGIDLYRLREGINGAADAVIYAGAEPRLARSNMALGTYCYRVRAIIEDGEWGPYSETKCTTVSNEGPTFECTFEALYDLPKLTNYAAVTLLDNGEVFIAGGEDVNAVDRTEAFIFNPGSRKFRAAGTSFYPGHEVATTLPDGRVLLPQSSQTAVYPDVRMEIFDPATGLFTAQASKSPCQDIDLHHSATAFPLYADKALLACESADEANNYYRYDYEQDSVIPWLQTDATCYSRFCYNAHPLAVMLNNWVITNGFAAFRYDGTLTPQSISVDDTASNLGFLPYGAIASSWDGDQLFATGGFYSGELSGDGPYPDQYSREALVLNNQSFTLTKLPSLNVPRSNHNLVALPNGNMVVLGGRSAREPTFANDPDISDETEDSITIASVELFDAGTGRFYEAGALNIKRYNARAISLLNGEILVLGGTTDPGPGHSTIAPPEVGSCRRVK